MTGTERGAHDLAATLAATEQRHAEELAKQSTLDLKRLRALTDSATKGPWIICTASDGDCSCRLVWSRPFDEPVFMIATASPEDAKSPLPRKEDWHFVAACRSAMPMLLDHVEQLRAGIFDLIAQLGWTLSSAEHNGLPDEMAASFKRRIEELRKLAGDGTL
jgi:hypothetical protein